MEVFVIERDGECFEGVADRHEGEMMLRNSESTESGVKTFNQLTGTLYQVTLKADGRYEKTPVHVIRTGDDRRQEGDKVLVAVAYNSAGSPPKIMFMASQERWEEFDDAFSNLHIHLNRKVESYRLPADLLNWRAND